MSWYEALTFIHVLGAMLWLGGGAFQLFAAGRMAGVAGPTALPWARTMQAAGNKYFSRVAIITLVAGVAVVALDAGVRFAEVWILVGLGGVAVSIGIEAGLIGRTVNALVDACTPETHDDASVVPLLARVRRLAVADLTVQTAVVIVMVTKPGG
jgi:hypothetical protein